MGPLLLLVAGCQTQDGGTARDCVDLPSGCAGVEQTTLGTGDFHTEGVACVSVRHVQSGAATGGDGSRTAPFADLPEAAAVAVAGDCIALSRGSYRGATLPASVSLLGRGSAQTTVGPLTVSGGQDAVIRGLKVTGAGTGIAVLAADRLRVQAVLVTGTQPSGIWIQGGQDVSLVQVRVAEVHRDPADDASVGNGVVSLDSTALVLESVLVERCEGSGIVSFGGGLEVGGSLIRDHGGYGVAAGCRLEGDCLAAPGVRVHDSHVIGNTGVGLWLSGVRATVEETTVSGTVRAGAGFARNLEAVAVPDLQLRGSRVTDGEDLGILLHETSGQVEDTVVSGHGGRGMWIQHPGSTGTSTVRLVATDVQESQQVGVGVLGACDVTMAGGQVSATRLGYSLVDDRTVEQGDGVQAVLGASLHLSLVTLTDNARVGLMADRATLVDVQSCTFGGSPLVADMVITGTEAGQISTGGNVGPGGAAVSPYMPPDPMDYDGNAMSVHMPGMAP